jgi:hypothetical protein
MTQNDAIYHHLRKGNPITPLEALKRFGCFRLAARIAELRESGIPIRAEMVKVDTLTGPKQVAQYRMAKNELRVK